MLCFAASTTRIPLADDAAEHYFSESVRAAGVAYATTRGLNAVVSVVKGSQLEVAPAGIGVSIAAGQILDPIDDMTERLSSLLVAAIASLGIQKLGHEIGMALSFKLLALLLVLALPLIWFGGRNTESMIEPGIKLLLILLLLRFMLPLSALGSEALYNQWLAPDIERSLAELSSVKEEYEEMRTIAPEQDQGFFASMTTSAAEKVQQSRQTLQRLIEHAETIIAALLDLATAYLAIFVLQVLLLPLAMLWLLVAIYRSNALGALARQLTQRLIIA